MTVARAFQKGFVPSTELYKGKVPVVEWFPEDITFSCPVCDERVSWPRKRTSFRCSSCHAPLAGFVYGTRHDRVPDWKPPRIPLAQHEKKVLGNLFGDCPMRVAEIPYFVKDKVQLKDMHSADPDIFWREVVREAVLYARGKRPRQQVAHNGMLSAQRKLAVLQGGMRETKAPEDSSEATRAASGQTAAYERAVAELDEKGGAA